VYSGRPGEKRNKYKWAVTHFNTPEAMLATVDHSHHRLRRAPVAPFFSKANVRKLDYILHENLSKFRRQLQKRESTHEPFNILDGFKALTGDVITTYAFGQSNNNLDLEDFNAGFWKLFHDLSAQGTPNNHFEWILPTIRALPDWMHRAMGMEYVLAWEKAGLELLPFLPLRILLYLFSSLSVPLVWSESTDVGTRNLKPNSKR
jgi:hypothetical protein